jgi:hypothetical protein
MRLISYGLNEIRLFYMLSYNYLLKKVSALWSKLVG